MSFRSKNAPVTTSSVTLTPPGELHGDVTVIDTLTLPAPAAPSEAARKSDVDAAETAANSHADAQAGAALAAANTHADAQAAAAQTAAQDYTDNKFDAGFVSSVSANGAGDISANHTLGVAPLSIAVTPWVNGLTTLDFEIAVENVSNVAINFRVFHTGGAAWAGKTVSFFWMAFK